MFDDKFVGPTHSWTRQAFADSVCSAGCFGGRLVGNALDSLGATARHLPSILPTRRDRELTVLPLDDTARMSDSGSASLLRLSASARLDVRVAGNEQVTCSSCASCALHRQFWSGSPFRCSPGDCIQNRLLVFAVVPASMLCRRLRILNTETAGWESAFLAIVASSEYRE